MAVLLKNNAVSRLAASITTGATALSVTAGDGAKFPAPGAGDWFPLTLVKPDGTLEILSCTGRSGDVLTVVRAQEGTAALAFNSGDRAELRVTAAALNTVLGGSGVTPTFGGLELVSSAPFVDFHYGSSSTDFTSRLASDAANELVISSVNGAQARFADGALTSYKLIVAANGVMSYSNVRVRNGAAGEYCDYGSTGAIATYNAAGTLLSNGNIYHSGNFNPATKVTADAIIHAGFAGNDVTLPYFRRISDNNVYYLQPRLGFTPVQQASPYTIKFGWTGSRLDSVVDTLYLGAITTDATLPAVIGAQGTGGVGTYALLARTGGASANPGDLVAGSGLVYSSINSPSGASPAGTWRCMGICNGGAATVWLRAS